MSGEATERLAAFASTLRYESIPAAVRDHAKNLLLDALACALAGYGGEETPQVTALASALAESEEASVIGGERLSLAGATLLNGYLITAVTMCDVHRATMTHVTPEIIPAALAIAERDDCSGRDLLVAIVAGCEVTTRIGIGLDYPAFRGRGFHGPGVLGPFGAAAAIGRLRSFDGEAMARAFGLAGSQAAGTYAAWGTPTVKFHQCRGALSGLLAALLAEQGFRATHEFLTAADGGLYASYAEGGKPDLAVADLGTRWEMLQIALRLWPSASLLQGLNTALFELIERQPIDPGEITTARVSLSQEAFDMHGKLPRYRGKFDALISGHYTAAVALHDRALTLRQYEASRYEDPVLRRFAEHNIEMRPDPALTGVQTEVQIETASGTTFKTRCEHPLGAPENPLSRPQLEQKFRSCAAERLSAAAIDAVIDAANELETFASTRALMHLLRASSTARASAEAAE